MTRALGEERVALVLDTSRGGDRRPRRKSIFSSEPWPPIESATGRASVSMFVMLADRVHAARCQNWRAWVLARSCVSSIRSGSAIHGGLLARVTGDAVLGGDVVAAEGLRQWPVRLRAKAERRALVFAQVPSPPPVPEYTVRIVTFWPSSRRLAMRPPHESAMSSGWGATKTWVIGWREYQRRSVSEAMLAKQRHEHGAARAAHA